MPAVALRTPCHAKELVGGPARGWCPVCGRPYQADDPRLRPDLPPDPRTDVRTPTGPAPLSRSAFAEVCASDYGRPRTRDAC